MTAGFTDTIVKWESKGLSNENIKHYITSNHNLSAKLQWMNNLRTRTEFKGSCLKQNRGTFTPRNVVILFIVYELNTWSRDLNAGFTLKDCLFVAVKSTKNADPYKYSYSGNDIGFDSSLFFSLLNFDWDKNVVIFGVGNSSSLHIDNNFSFWRSSNTRIR